jgi:lysyl-tRNA synthetase class I
LLLTKGTGTKIYVIHNCAFLKIQELHIWATHHVKLTWKPNWWTELSIHQEGLATGQHDQGFAWFSSSLEEILGWFPNCSVCFSCSILTITFKISSKMQPLRGLLTEICHNASLYMQNSTTFQI